VWHAAPKSQICLKFSNYISIPKTPNTSKLLLKNSEPLPLEQAGNEIGEIDNFVIVIYREMVNPYSIFKINSQSESKYPKTLKIPKIRNFGEWFMLIETKKTCGYNTFGPDNLMPEYSFFQAEQIVLLSAVPKPL
jgi:hypothetical protein